MANVNSAQSPAMERAIQFLRGGNTVEAEAVMQAHAKKVRDRHGANSPAHQLAMNELGIVLMNARQLSRAIEAFSVACSGPLPGDAQDLRDRLTHLMNLGQALEQAGRFEEAEQALRRGVQGREKCYGRRHAGYGFGMEPLAVILMRQGKLDEAISAIAETERNFRRNGHPRVSTALAFRAEIHAAAGREGPLFPERDLHELPRGIIEDMVKAVLQRVGQAEPMPLRRVLNELLPIASKRLGEGHHLAISLLMSQANLERILGPEGDPAVRIAAISRAVEVLDGADHPADAANAMLGLALACCDYGRIDDADVAYRDAVARAERIGEAALQSQALRNYGLFLAEQERRDEAEGMLRAAVEHSNRGGDQTMRGRARVALGIFLQHGQRLEEAGPHLRAGLEALDPADPDAITARSHLGAIESGGACGCGDTREAVAEALRATILPRLPEGLVARLDFVPDDNGQIQPSLQMNREPTEEEMDDVYRVITHAMAELRERLGRAS